MSISQSLTIRPETSRDSQVIAQVYTLAFGQDNEARLVEKIRASKYYLPSLSLVAELDRLIVGHVLFSYINLVGAQPVLSLAPLAVLPEWQNQGVGSKLVEVGLDRAEARREPLVVVLGHPHFYRRFRFQPASCFGIEAPFSVPEEAFMVKPLKNYQESYRGKVSYPPAFGEV